ESSNHLSFIRPGNPLKPGSGRRGSKTRSAFILSQLFSRQGRCAGAAKHAGKHIATAVRRRLRCESGAVRPTLAGSSGSKRGEYGSNRKQIGITGESALLAVNADAD